MRILLTNDDGIDAPGLHALREIAAQLSDDVWVVAPETNQSGASHSLSLHEPLRLRRIDDRAYAVRGTPTDSVIMGVRHILRDKLPDLVLSGVNRGANMAEDVTYSGTIAGAFEGTILGIRSIALSQAIGFGGGQPPGPAPSQPQGPAPGQPQGPAPGQPQGPAPAKSIKWQTALAHAPAIVRKLLAIEWPPSCVMNVNFPDREPGEVEGTMVTVQGRRDPDLLQIEERHDTWGNPYYWLAFQRRRSSAAEGSDLAAVYAGCISVTPLYLDLTYEAMREKVRRALG